MLEDEEAEDGRGNYRLAIDVEVHDPRELWEAARQSYMDQTPSATPDEMDELFGPEDEIGISECLIMMLDPGVSPPGTEILGSEVVS
jgi:hypothetical protein